MNIENALRDGISAFKPKKHIVDPHREAEILLAHSIQKNRAFLYTHPEYTLKEDENSTWQCSMMQRLEGIPIAYITQTKEFWSLPLHINPHVLIPRPETETLVEVTLDHMSKKPEHILELGTGSGAISIAIAHTRPDCQITAVDICPNAIALAKRNASALGITNIQFIVSNWFEGISNTQFDIIVSNPPYIEEKDPHIQQGDLRFEPKQALISGPDGLEALRHIILKGYAYLKPKGWLCVEHGYNQKKHVLHILNQAGYVHNTCFQDNIGHPRVSIGCKDIS